MRERLYLVGTPRRVFSAHRIEGCGVWAGSRETRRSSRQAEAGGPTRGRGASVGLFGLQYYMMRVAPSCVDIVSSFVVRGTRPHADARYNY